MAYLINSVNTYRVENIAAALALREELQNTSCGELVSFSYTHKDIKAKGEIVDSYELCKAKLQFCSEKEPDVQVEVTYGNSY